MQDNLHSQNREEPGGPLPRTPTRCRTKQHRCVQTSRAPFQSSQPLPPQHDYLRAILTPREHRKPQKSRTKINFSTGYTLHTESMNASHPINLFTNSCDQTFTNGKAPLHSLNHNNPQFFYSL